MVHQQLDALRMGIVVEHLDVKVGIRCHEVEDVTLPLVGPVFPSDIPTLDEHLLQAVGSSEVNVAFHLLVIGAMTTIRLDGVPVDGIEFDGGEFIGIIPAALANNHLPPDTTVLRGMYPRRIFYLTRFVEVQNEVIGQHVASIITDHDGTPGRLTRCLHTAL